MQPVSQEERLPSLDVLRGFALLGILIMNIAGMGLPRAAYINPTIAGGAEGADLWFWFLAHIFVDGKMRALFSLLFGAGVVLLLGRLAEKEGSPARLYYRRTFLLIGFGLLHGNLLFYGDVLYGYGICGLLLYWLRNWPAKRLLIAGILVLVLNVAMGLGARMQFTKFIEEQRQLSAQSSLSPEDAKKLEKINKQLSMFAPSPESVDAEIVERRGTWSAIAANSRFAREFEGKMFFQAFLLDILGMMLLGMGLAKSGILAGQASRSFYWRGLVLGFLIGLPVLAWSGWAWRADNYSIPGFFGYIGTTIDAGRFAVAFAYLCGFLLLLQAGALRGVTGPLAKVGRMAFTNYILCSALALFVFSGFGLGLFNQLSRVQLLWVVLPIWTIILVLSQWWLSRFRFGPLEWIWRSLTYGKAQPMR
jgi:uncharacterized protein